MDGFSNNCFGFDPTGDPGGMSSFGNSSGGSATPRSQVGKDSRSGVDGAIDVNVNLNEAALKKLFPGLYGDHKISRKNKKLINKAINKMRFVHPLCELWEVVIRNDDGTFELIEPGQTGMPGANTLSRVPCISLMSRNIKPGMLVNVRYNESNRSRPYIKNLYPRSTGNAAPAKSSALNVPIDAGMWIQSGGFWWTSYSSVFPQAPLPVPLAPITVTETFTGSELAVQSFIAIETPPGTTFGASGIIMELVELPAPGHYQNLSLKHIKITTADGEVDWITYFTTNKGSGAAMFPYSLITNDELLPGHPTWSASPDNLNSLPFITLQIIPDTNPATSPAGPLFNFTDITQIKIIYEYQEIATTVFSGEAGTGPDTAISPRGLVMFPNTSQFGNAHQIVSTLMSTYTPLEGELFPHVTTETLSYVEGAVGTTLLHTPVSFSDEPNSVFADLNAAGIYYGLFTDGPSVYAVAEAQLDGVNANGNEIDITYLYATGPEEPDQDFFTADGISNTFTLGQPINPTTTITGVFDLTLNITIFIYSFDVTTNIVTLGSVPPVGDVINIQYTLVPTASQTDIFTFDGTSGSLMANGQTVFALSQAPINASVITVPYFPDGNGFFFFGTTPVLFPMLDGSGKNVQFAITHVDGDLGSSMFTYTYNTSSGTMFNITGQSVLEIDMVSNTTRTLNLPYSHAVYSATPSSDYLSIVGSGTPLALPGQPGNIWLTGWQYQNWGYLHYDPIGDCYTAITPIGIFWRSRRAGDIIGNGYTFRAWPDENNTNDPTLIGWSYPDDTQTPTRWLAGAVESRVPFGQKRRTKKYAGVSCISIYILQGSWGPCGKGLLGQKILLAPVSFGGGSGAPSDTDYTIRLFVRNANTNAITLAKEISVLTLPQDVHSFEDRLYVPGCGIVNEEAVGGYATGRADPGFGVKNSWWPAARDASAWLIGCGWCTSNWGLDVSGLNNKAQYTLYPIGLEDAAYTLSVYDPKIGNLLDFINYRCDPSDILLCYALGDLDKANASILARDLAGAAAPVFELDGISAEGTISYGCIPPFDTIGYVIYAFYMTSYDSPKKPLLKIPGIPALADNFPRYANLNYGTIGHEDQFASQRIAGDGNDYFYFCLSVPYWARVMNFFGPGGAQVVTKTGTFSFHMDGSPDISSPSIFFNYDLLGYGGSPSIATTTSASLNSVPGTTTWTSAFSGIFATFNHQVFQPPRSAFTGPTITFDDSDPPVPTAHYVFTGGTVSVGWTQLIPDPDNSTFVKYYTLPTSGIVISGGFQVGPASNDPAATFKISTSLDHVIDEIPGPDGDVGGMPLNGGATFSGTGNNCQAYVQNARTFLKKVKYDRLSRKLSEVWSVDVSVLGPIQGNASWSGATPGSSTALPLPLFKRVFFTRPCGRFIFLLREDVSAPYVEVWDNSNSIPTAPRFTLVLTGLANYKDWEMQEGIDTDTNEWVLITATNNAGLQGKWQIRCDDNPAVTPTLKFSSTVDDSVPTSFNVQGMAYGNNNFFFTNDIYSLIERPGAE